MRWMAESTFIDFRARTVVRSALGRSCVVPSSRHVAVWDCCRGLVPAQHVAGPGKKGWPKPGQRVSVRVLECDAGSRRLTLTMKRLLLEEKLAPFASWDVSLLMQCHSMLHFTGRGRAAMLMHGRCRFIGTLLVAVCLVACITAACRHLCA